MTDEERPLSTDSLCAYSIPDAAQARRLGAQSLPSKRV